ncbi:hypothetical protein [Ferruginibacter profundus]
MNETIAGFLAKQTCATICSVGKDNKPWCFSCFYVCNPAEGLLYYKSAADTQHSLQIKNDPFVAGTVLPDKLNSLQIRGLQFEGLVVAPEDPVAENAAALYYKKNPLALAMPGEIWTVKLLHIKMTDSTLGIGKKIKWSREAELV